MKSEKRLSQTLIHPENEIHLKTRNIEEGNALGQERPTGHAIGGWRPEGGGEQGADAGGALAELRRQLHRAVGGVARRGGHDDARALDGGACAQAAPAAHC